MKHIYLFVSSTFEDMADERELLVREVFPEVEKFCNNRGITFHSIDLRWGITKQQADELNETIYQCLKIINDSHPLFLSFIGQRYGWIPTENELNLDKFENKNEIQKYLGKSATELEIVQALYNLFFPGEKKESLFCIKEPSYLESISNEEFKKKYYDTDESKVVKLENLKNEIINSGHDYIYYSSSFENITIPYFLESLNENYSKGIIQTNFQSCSRSLSDVLIDKIISKIQKVTNNQSYVYNKYDDQFKQEYLLNYYSQSVEIPRIDKYIESLLEEKSGKLNFLLMEDYFGKSSGLARLITKSENEDYYFIYRFLGLDIHSSSIKQVLHSFVQELSYLLNYSFEIENNFVSEYNFLEKALIDLEKKGKKIVIIVDSVQNTKNHFNEWVYFLKDLPCSKVIISGNESLVENVPFFNKYTNEELKIIIEYIFAKFGKRIDNVQFQKLIDLSKGHLYNILFVIKYLIRFSTYESLEKDIEKFIKNQEDNGEDEMIKLVKGVILLDNKYSALLPNIILNSNNVQNNYLSWLTYTLFLVEEGLTQEELIQIVLEISKKENTDGINEESVIRHIKIAIKAYSNEIFNIGGLLTLKDKLYTLYLFLELELHISLIELITTTVAEVIYKIIISGNYVERHIYILKNIIKKGTLLSQIYCIGNYWIDKTIMTYIIEILGYSYYKSLIEDCVKLIPSKEKFFQQITHTSLNEELAEHIYEFNSKQLKNFLKVLNTIKNTFNLDIKEIFSFLNFVLGYDNQKYAISKFINEYSINLEYKLYEIVKDYNEIKDLDLFSGLTLELPGDLKIKTALIKDNALYITGNDERIYILNSQSGECNTIIRTKKDYILNSKKYDYFGKYKGNIMFIGKKYVYFWDEANKYLNILNIGHNKNLNLKDCWIYGRGDCACIYEDGSICVIINLIRKIHINDFIGKMVEKVFVYREKLDIYIIVLVKYEGFYIFINEKFFKKLPKVQDINLYSKSYCGVDEEYLFFLNSFNEVVFYDLVNDREEKISFPLTFGSFFMKIKENLFTNYENYIIHNGSILMQPSPDIIMDIIGRRLYYISENKLHSLLVI